MIHVLATIELVKGKRVAFLEEFRKIIPLVRAEDGCIEYGPAVDSATDIEPQQLKGDDVVTVIEKWENVEALKAHLVAPHMVDYRPKVKAYVVRTTLHILEPAD